MKIKKAFGYEFADTDPSETVTQISVQRYFLCCCC